MIIEKKLSFDLENFYICLTNLKSNQLFKQIIIQIAQKQRVQKFMNEFYFSLNKKRKRNKHEKAQ